MLKITQKKKSSKITKYCEEKYWILRNIPFVEINIWKLINYSIDMCWNGQGIMIFITKYNKWLQFFQHEMQGKHDINIYKPWLLNLSNPYSAGC
jgi:hypothetical protein